MFQEGINFLLDLLLPKTCACCGREGEFFCSVCQNFLPTVFRYEPLAAESLLEGFWYLDQYQNQYLRSLILNLKYNFSVQALPKALANCRFDSRLACLGNYLTIPIPLHRRRQLWRGYNQAEEIAKVLKLPELNKNILKRKKYTTPQVGLDKAQRLKNLHGGFVLDSSFNLAGKNVLLVDDVYTTGSTLRECAILLKKAKVAKIYGLVLAKD